MSLNNSIGNCRTPFAVGSSRQVFFSKKYNVVIKKPYEDGYNYHRANSQSIAEQKMYAELDDKEKEFFPIVGFTTDRNGDTIVLMKRIEHTLYELGEPIPYSCLEDVSMVRQSKWLNEMKKKYNLKFSATRFIKVIRRLGIRDLHARNLGILGDKLVIIDFGW